MVEFTSKSNTLQTNEYRSTESGLVAMRLPALPFCFLWLLSTRGDHRDVIYGGSWFVCTNMEVGKELQAAELNAYLVAKDSFLVAKAFQKLKMSGACILGVWQELQKNRPASKL